MTIRRRLAAASPARYDPDLAMSLSNLCAIQGETGDAAGALEAIQEAVRLLEGPAAKFPEGLHAQWLAVCRGNLSRLQGEQDQAEQSDEASAA